MSSSNRREHIISSATEELRQLWQRFDVEDKLQTKRELEVMLNEFPERTRQGLVSKLLEVHNPERKISQVVSGVGKVLATFDPDVVRRLRQQETVFEKLALAFISMEN
ncbi:hypothetical protein VFPPC_18026 [Pochonia chlamydosporia 170]|uniref:Uncharacterized protein n=1 Tax=Pochonia chlamydosporia 170 TaxID=1380566 RepID=A0A219APZ0_METCM|nr:hypothetical protein VFPPC_18026 [Pochonia chlamydosporia 170]OWT42771.1 hypothetical protein VFPPC_18026 [Pochonia chlamydosporia 170]